MVEAPARCPVCHSNEMVPVYHSGTKTSLSSLCQILPGAKIVSYCSECGHLAGTGVVDTDQFYETDYRILLDDDEEDQVYEIRGDEIISRTDHQMAVLHGKAGLAANIRVLDYGCAKAAMARRITRGVPGIDMHLFDVSHMYETFWDKFVAREKQAVHRTPEAWDGRFDLVTSFFAFEHIPDPKASIAHVARLLKPGGLFHMIVPDVTGNAADFIVIDHVNHFTRSSVARLMTDSGFGEIDIDTTSYRGALIVTGRKTGTPPSAPVNDAEKAEVLAQARELAQFWSTAADRIRASEPEENGSGGSAIYGSGFYGAFIHANLKRPEAVACFLDKSPWQQGKSLFDTPIMAPADLPGNVDTVYAGLNPAIAHQVMNSQPWAGREGLRVVYLQDSAE
ncbi:MAG: class I SAM-dependent methyltransferase [Hoeflea sp.]|uniref:class I SAM-dependent methyltransferase n=1 Tax=Hoeflea sp. TaxID=1940281 RepID=UPI0032EF6326